MLALVLEMDLNGVMWNLRALPSDGARREYTGAGNAKYRSGVRYGCRKQYLVSGRARLDAPNLPPEHITQKKRDDPDTSFVR